MYGFFKINDSIFKVLKSISKLQSKEASAWRSQSQPPYVNIAKFLFQEQILL